MNKDRIHCKFWLLFIVMAGLLTLVGCTKTLDYELPYAGDKLVVNGLLSPDKPVTLRVSRTAPVTGSQQVELGVADATVTLWEDDVFIEQLEHSQQGRYISPSNFKPSVGKAYFVKVAVSGFPSVETMPEKIPSANIIDRYAFDEAIQSTYNEDYPARKLSLQFTDDTNTTDFYSMAILGSFQGQKVSINTYYLDRAEDADNPCGFLGGNDKEFNLTDICFNGRAYTVNIGVETAGNNQALDGKYTECDLITVRFRKISRKYYEYLKNGNQPEDIFLAFAEPNILQSNVKGGFGILSAYNESTIKFKLK